MRVISGECKGRPLKAVPGTSTRPTTDKVKESIFNMIGPFFNGGIGLDLFGGSGGLGIESLSRGFEKFIFVDREAKAISTIKENVKKCHYEDKVEIYRNDAVRALKALHKRELTFDMIFLDPPYAAKSIPKVMELIDEYKLLQSNGKIICEHDASEKLPDTIASFAKSKVEIYGKQIAVTIYTYVDIEDSNE
ncbi:16S rRNA (guanine(966)-N(2))-methyltransferase RsmD [Lottiidibacillus patelloidae]|uniref:16S rRNA (Guanine(966)-N(2))-methyltransferase RsmD n=1 Tax=Lottiidibacillus patelloidae TaxID=2670334 RepID=A0A263BXN5_9BACI|nr:16S rRNA (guanine(966)-N(2))-methyltransferase RsmD [Lottiidibacillus patelloidae]OZM58485.1 16S rRNA (guanine(966)-N(2))-methyltransferase RsmD [Lottiidibacillus patelloidae]